MSKTQPFCDYSHKGTLIKGVKFSIDEKIEGKSMYLCGCKLTKNAPFCDGETCLGLMNGKSPFETELEDQEDEEILEIEGA